MQHQMLKQTHYFLIVRDLNLLTPTPMNYFFLTTALMSPKLE